MRRRRACVWEDEAIGEAGPDGRGWEQRWERGSQKVRELAQGAGWPGVDLEVGRERSCGGRREGEVGEAVRYTG